MDDYLKKLMKENLMQARVNTKALKYIINKTCMKQGNDVITLFDRFKTEIEEESNKNK